MRQLFWTLLKGLVILAVVVTIAGFFGRFHPLLELVTNIPHQLFVLLFLITLIALWRRRWQLAMLAGLFALVQFVLVAPYYRPLIAPVSAESSPSSPTYSTLLLNVYYDNNEYDRVLQLVEDTDPDLIVLQEATPEWWEGVQSLRDEYTYVVNRSMPWASGIVVLSRLPFSAEIPDQIGSDHRPAVTVELDLDGRPLTFVTVHTYASRTEKWKYEDREQELKNLAEFVQAQTNPVFVLGDLNITPWSTQYRDLLANTNLNSAQAQFGLQPTWPSMVTFLGFPLDHGLYTPGVRFTTHETSPAVGSDHLPVFIEFALDDVES